MVCTQMSASLATPCFVCTDERLMYSSDWTQLHTDTALLLMRGLNQYVTHVVPPTTTRYDSTAQFSDMQARGLQEQPRCHRNI
jgi:hypothetical protein